MKPFPSQLPVVIASFKDGDSSTELRKVTEIVCLRVRVNDV